MTTTPEDLLNDRDPDLDQLEEETLTTLAATLAALTALTPGQLAGTLAGLHPRITTLLTSAAATALLIGATRARQDQPVTTTDDWPTTPTQQQARDMARDLGIASAVAFILQDAARKTTTLTVDQLADHLTATTTRLWREMVTTIHRAANHGRAWYARVFGLELVWLTRGDERVCPTCGPLHGTTAPATGYDTNTAWAGFDRLPPAHPLCRCYTQVRTPR